MDILSFSKNHDQDTDSFFLVQNVRELIYKTDPSMIQPRPARKSTSQRSCTAQTTTASTDPMLMQNLEGGTEGCSESVVDKCSEVCKIADWESDGIKANWNHPSYPLCSEQNFMLLLSTDPHPPLPNALTKRTDMVQVNTPQPDLQVFGGEPKINIEAEEVSIISFP